MPREENPAMKTAWEKSSQKTARLKSTQGDRATKIALVRPREDS